MTLLIVARAAFGMMLLSIAVVCGYLNVTSKDNAVIIGTAIGCIACFCTGVYFCDAALKREIWRKDQREVSRPRLYVEPDSDETDTDITLPRA